MSPFAPQAFTWTNVGFIGLCLFMQVLASWLPDRTARKPDDAGQANAFAIIDGKISPPLSP